MNYSTHTNLKLKIAKSLVLLSVGLLITACGTTKSSEVLDQSSAVQISADKPLASCNRLDNSNFSINIANVKKTDGTINPDWLKLKFNFISQEMAQAGNHFRLYKWRVINGTTQLVDIPLEFSGYTLANGQSSTNTMNSALTAEISTQVGLYISLKDDAQYPFQVLKLVIYKSDGSIAAQDNILIPEFLANPEDYKFNPDGTNRNMLLQQKHPLFGKNTAGWTSSQFMQAFDKHCF